jgi:peptide/nickel transport system substrate-binding protein
VRNEDYWKNKLPEGAVPLWNNQQPYMDEIIWIYYSEAAAVIKDLTNGNLDADVDVEPIAWAQAETNTQTFTDRMARAEGLNFGYTYIGWNFENPIFQDKDVRLALAMLIPRQEIAETVHMGAAFPVSGPFFLLSPSYDKEIKPVPHDPRGAQQLLTKAGWLDRDGDGVREKEIDGKLVPLRFTYTIHNARDYHQKIADIVKERVEQAGISVLINKVDWTRISDLARQHNFDAIRYAWGTNMDPDVFQMFHSSQIANQGDNFTSYRNDRVDELTQAIREEMDPLQRWKMGRELHRIFADDQAQCFMFAFKHFLFHNRQLRNVKVYPHQYPFDYAGWYWEEKPAEN